MMDHDTKVIQRSFPHHFLANRVNDILEAPHPTSDPLTWHQVRLALPL